VKSLPILAALALASCSPAKPDIAVSDAWSRPTTSAAQPAVVYLTLANAGSGGDRLTKVAADIAGRASLHNSSMDGGVMRMRPVDGVKVPAGATVKLSPSGTHIMLEQLKRPLADGTEFGVTLEFDHSPARKVTVKVAGDLLGEPHHGH
jgi:copper(I)-binding protein